MGRALASPAASSFDSPAAPRTPTSCRRSSDQHRIAVPPPACLNPQSEPHVVPSRRLPRASSLALARIRQRLSDCRIFTPAQPNHSVASSEGFLLRRLQYGLDQEFNSLDAQHEAAEAYIRSQAHDGWTLIRTRYDDGGYSGGSTERPALQRLLADIRDRRIDIVVVYKVDRLTRSLADFAKLVELFDAHSVSFVSVTQQFNTTTSMGRLTLNVLLSFAQFEREVTGERIRDKIGASKRKGLWVGGMVPLGYVSRDKKLFIEEEEAERVRTVFRRYLDLGSISLLLADLRKRGIITKVRQLSG